MSGFDDFKGMAKDVTQAVGRRSGELVEISKLRISATQLKNKIRNKYEKLGGDVYEAVRSHNENTDFILDYVDEIQKLKSELRSINNKINTILGNKPCPNCKKVNKKNVRFCADCGQELEEIDDVLGV